MRLADTLQASDRRVQFDHPSTKNGMSHLCDGCVIVEFGPPPRSPVVFTSFPTVSARITAPKEPHAELRNFWFHPVQVFNACFLHHKNGFSGQSVGLACLSIVEILTRTHLTSRSQHDQRKQFSQSFARGSQKTISYQYLRPDMSWRVAIPFEQPWP